LCCTTPGYPMIMPEVARDLQATVERNMREDGQHLLDRAVSLLPNRVSASMQIVAGTPAEVILAMAERERIDLIVMGARGVGLIREAMFGSVAHRVIKHATCATLAVTAPLPSVQRILLALALRKRTEAFCSMPIDWSARPLGADQLATVVISLAV
jgi:hypothetical protein